MQVLELRSQKKKPLSQSPESIQPQEEPSMQTWLFCWVVQLLQFQPQAIETVQAEQT